MSEEMHREAAAPDDEADLVEMKTRSVRRPETSVTTPLANTVTVATTSNGASARNGNGGAPFSR
jgi:hypothetical protein